MTEKDPIVLVSGERNNPIAVNERALLSMIAAHIRTSTMVRLEQMAAEIEAELRAPRRDDDTTSFAEVRLHGDFIELDVSMSTLGKLVEAYVRLSRGESIDLRLYLGNV